MGNDDVLFDPDAIERTRRARLKEMVAYARAHSPYYRELYKDLPDEIDDVRQLPVTDKKRLMARFDDWATDRDVTYEKVQKFIDDPKLIGQRFLDKYRIATTSGSTGSRGFFVLDPQYDAVAKEAYMLMMRPLAQRLSAVRSPRTAMIMATGGHSGAYSRLKSGTTKSWNADATRSDTENASSDTENAHSNIENASSDTENVHSGAGNTQHDTGNTQSDVPSMMPFSVHMPLGELVAQLNQYQPTMLQGYASTISLLADEQEAGRLHISPVLITPSSEGLTDREYDKIANVFHAEVTTFYGSTESVMVALGCKYHWLHMVSDWTIAEPVDANYQPVVPGVQSHTLLISNLSNRVQPILRYDIGDSVLVRPDRCPCGNPMPAIRVLGRVADVLTFPIQDHEPARITSIQFSSMFDSIPEAQLFQIVQTDPTTLRIRLRTAPGIDKDQVWHKVQDKIGTLLRSNNLEHVRLELATELPEQTKGGKYRMVLPLH